MSVKDDKISDLKRVCCSWEVLNERSLDDALTFETRDISTRKRSLECMVSLETCVHLGVQNQMVPCLLELNLKKEGLKISEICIVSEARIIEIYGKCGEYLATCHAEFFDECEDMMVYVADFKFPQPTSECSLKFARMKVKEQMWLYGIYVSTEEDSISHESVNFSNVNKILKESSHQITDKADRCKKFLQMYSSYCVTNTSQTLPNPQTLFKIFDSLYLNQCSVGTQAKSVSKCLSDLFPGLTFSKSKSDGSSEHNPDNTAPEKIASFREADGCLKYIFEELKQHIDKKFSELAVSLTFQVDRRLNELQEQQNKKLDEIINLIQNTKVI